MKRLRRYALALGLVPFITACPKWHDGYALAYRSTAGIELRFEPSTGWQDAGRIAVPGSGTFFGVGLARRNDNDTRSVLGYNTSAGVLQLYTGIGLAFGASPTDVLPGVSSGPAVVHVAGDEWLVAFTNSNGSVELRPYLYAPNGGFQNSIGLAVTNNDNVADAPAIAYFNGRLVLVWGRTAGSRAFHFVAADYQPRSNSITVVQEGDIASGPTTISDFTSAPSLAHNGAGSFYLAIHERTGNQMTTPGPIHVLSSADGRAWTYISAQLPASPQGTRVSIAAKPDGDVLLGVISGASASRMYRLRSGTWLDLGQAGFSTAPDFTSTFALIRNQYLQD